MDNNIYEKLDRLEKQIKELEQQQRTTNRRTETLFDLMNKCSKVINSLVGGFN